MKFTDGTKPSAQVIPSPQINTVDDIIEQNSNSLGVLGSVFEDYDMVKDVNLEPDGGEGGKLLHHSILKCQTLIPF